MINIYFNITRLPAAEGHSLLVTRHSSLVTCHLLFVTRLPAAGRLLVAILNFSF